MTTYVRKRSDDSIQTYSPGETVVLDDGTKIPYGNLDHYSASTLLEFGLYGFQPPVVPSGKYLVSVDYTATPDGVTQVPTFGDLPAGPAPSQSSVAASQSFIAALRRKARKYRQRGDIAGAVALLLKAEGIPQ